jgi:hypothetical protein
VGFMDEARDAAGREFGARHYRAFAFMALGRKVVPGIAAVVVVAGLLVGAAWLASNWDPIWATVGPWLATALWWIVSGVVLAVLLALAGVVYRRNRWRWQAF